MYSSRIARTTQAVPRSVRGELLGWCIRDLCDRLGFIIESRTRAHVHMEPYLIVPIVAKRAILVSQAAHGFIIIFLAPKISRACYPSLTDPRFFFSA